MFHTVKLESQPHRCVVLERSEDAWNYMETDPEYTPANYRWRDARVPWKKWVFTSTPWLTSEYGILQSKTLNENIFGLSLNSFTDCSSGPDYPLCRLYHGRGPPSQGGPRRSAAKFLPRCFDVWTFSVRLNVTTKKGRQLIWEKSAPPQIRKSWLRVREKGPRLTLVWGPPNG